MIFLNGPIGVGKTVLGRLAAAELGARIVGLGAYTSVEACAQALVDNLETRRRRVFVPRSVGVVSALRKVVTGALSEKVMLKISAGRVPQLEADIAKLNGQEFGKNSVGDRRSAA